MPKEKYETDFWHSLKSKCYCNALALSFKIPKDKLKWAKHHNLTLSLFQQKQLTLMTAMLTRKLTYFQQIVDNVTDIKQIMWLCLPWCEEGGALSVFLLCKTSTRLLPKHFPSDTFACLRMGSLLKQIHLTNNLWQQILIKVNNKNYDGVFLKMAPGTL